MLEENISQNVLIAAGQNLKEREYWLNKLSGELVKNHFPYDCKKNGDELKRNTVKIKLPDVLFDRITKISKGSDYTAYVILLAEVLLLLEIYSGSKDIIVGVPIEKQDSEGDYINTVMVLKNQLDDYMTFMELLLQVRQGIIEASENQNYPIETLLYDLDMTFTGNEFPLFDVAVLLENIHEKKYIHEFKPNVIFAFSKIDGKLELDLEYNSLSYYKSTIERIGRHFLHLTGETLFNGEQKLGEIDILPGQEKEQLLFGFNKTKTEYPSKLTINELVEKETAALPGAAVFIFEDKYLTYGELNARTVGLSRLLRSKGVNAETIVGIMTERSPEMVIAMLAVLKAGGAYLPVDSNHPEERIKYIFNDSGVNLVLTQKHLQERLTIDIEKIDMTNEAVYAAEIESNISNLARPSGLAYVIYTSGSTGKAKGVAVEHRSIVNTLLWRKEYYNFNQRDVVLQILSYIFDSSVEDIFTTLISRARLVLIPEDKIYDLQYLEKIIKKTNVTYFLIVPGFYNSFIEEIYESLKDVRAITVAGDNITEKLVKKHFEKLNHTKYYNEYGPTENSVCSTVYEFKPGQTKVLIGKPIKNVVCYILNPNNRLNPIGVPGELCVSGKGLARGYLNRPELTAEKFIELEVKVEEYRSHMSHMSYIYKTGDLTRWLADGNIEFLGRIDFQVKIRGFRIEPGEIERQLLKQEEIKEAVVISKETVPGNSADSDEKYLCAYIVAEKELVITKIKEILSNNLPAYMIPTYFMQMEKLPLTPNGKIDRKALPEPEVDTAITYVPPRNELERKLEKIWAEVLKIDNDIIGIYSNFFELGGHSLKATILASKIHKEFNVKIPLIEIFKTPTIEGMAGYITGAVEDTFTSIDPVEKKEYYDLSAAQKRLYILQQMKVESTAYNISQSILLSDEADIKKLEKTFNKLIQRHEGFRTSFHMVNDEPVQKIHDTVELKIAYYELISSRDKTGIEVEENRQERLSPIMLSRDQLIKYYYKAFDLSRAPLLKVGVVKTDEGKYLLVVTMHHIISDGYSHTILEKDFNTLYESKELSPLPIQYKDFSQWQNFQLNQTSLKEKALTYWKKKIKDGIPATELPVDFSGNRSDPRGVNYRLVVNKNITDRLNKMAREHHITLFTWMFSAYNILLSHLLEQNDIVVGIISAGRDHISLQDIVGFFVQAVVFKGHVDQDESFAAFLQRMNEEILEAFNCQQYPPELLFEVLNMRYPDISLAFNMLNVHEGSEHREIRNFASSHRESFADAKYDLELYVSQYKNGIEINCLYKKSLFQPSTIEYIMNVYVRLMDNLSAEQEA
jgi:bacitracin synthase 3